MSSFKITFINELSGLKEIIDNTDDKYIIDSASYQNIELPYSFRLEIACLTCFSRLEKVEVDHQDQSFLDDDQMNNGCFLICVAYPTSDCTIRANVEKEMY
tara:strand:- start:40 stop:342 length:303 start_codon:yes stop_codon:yes gene_type:complete